MQIVIHVISAALFRQLRVICAKTFRLRECQFLASLQVCGWRVKDALNWWTRESGQHSPNALIRVSRKHMGCLRTKPTLFERNSRIWLQSLPPIGESKSPEQQVKLLSLYLGKGFRGVRGKGHCEAVSEEEDGQRFTDAALVTDEKEGVCQ